MTFLLAVPAALEMCGLYLEELHIHSNVALHNRFAQKRKLGGVDGFHQYEAARETDDG